MQLPEPTAEQQVTEDYRLADRRFQLHVPEECRRRPPCGLLVWISADASGHLPRSWAGPLERARLLWVGADDAGDGRPLSLRVNLAVDAAWNVLQLLPVDPERVYVAGLLGAAQSAVVAALLYPDVFAGGLAGLGPALLPPATRSPGRLVLLTGDRDPHRDSLASLRAALLELRPAGLILLDLPGVGGELPSTRRIARALAALDAPG